MKNKKFVKISLMIFVLAILLFSPVSSFAAAPTGQIVCRDAVTNIKDLICRVGEILNYIIPFLLLLGVVYFVWGVVQYVIKDEEEAKKKGRDKIIYGLIGIVVIISMWGIVTLIINTFGISTAELAQITPGTTFSQTSNNYTQVSNICATNYKSLSEPLLGDLINYVTCTISKSIVPLLFTLATLLFVWGVVQYVINADSEEKRTKGRDFMIWGIVALAVMAGMWGLVNIFGTTFNIGNGTQYVPQVKSN